MRVLLRRQESGLYYVTAEMWTADPHHAHDFGTSYPVIELALARRWPDAEVVFSFDDPHYDIRFELSAPKSPPAGNGLLPK